MSCPLYPPPPPTVVDDIVEIGWVETRNSLSRAKVKNKFVNITSNKLLIGIVIPCRIGLQS